MSEQCVEINKQASKPSTETVEVKPATLAEVLAAQDLQPYGSNSLANELAIKTLAKAERHGNPNVVADTLIRLLAMGALMPDLKTASLTISTLK